MMMNYTKFEDFDINKLTLCNTAENKAYNYQSMGISYEYSDGNVKGLRLRSAPLFTYGVQAYKTNSKDYFMTSLSFYDEENPTEKETKFKKVLDEISDFLRKEAPKKYIKKRNSNNKDFNELEIVNQNNIFYPKLQQIKKYDKNKNPLPNDIMTSFYEKGKNKELVKIDPYLLEKVKCKVIVYMDITDIFIYHTTIEICTSISEVFIIKKHVPSPIRMGVDKFAASSELTFGSDDESETEDDKRV